MVSELPTFQAGEISARRVAAGSAIRCLVVDDHPAIRFGLSELLAAEADIDVLNAVASAEAAVGCVERTPIDVAVIDYQLGGRSGLWCSRKLKRLPDPPAVLIFSAFSDHLLAAACVVAQVDGLVSKTAIGPELCDRIRQAAAGVSRLPRIPPALVDSLRRRLDASEQAIFGMMQAAITTEEIGRTLGMDHGELEGRLWTMLQKLERNDPIG
jgi:DNA-binding NarL/FixJ family response regulator